MELLVVIAIIALLLALWMPAMRKIKEIARETACRSNLKNVGLAVLMYLDDFERKIPNTYPSTGYLWFESDGHTYLTPGSRWAYWGTFYKDYIIRRRSLAVRAFETIPEPDSYTLMEARSSMSVVFHFNMQRLA